MKKVLFTATAFSVASLFLSANPVMANEPDEDAYETAYAACAEKAESVGGDYDTAFDSCMTAKGLSVDESSEQEYEGGSSEEPAPESNQ